jgi:predicted XRE-type DNA-binding protein
MNINAFDIEIDHLGESRLIEDPRELMKLKLNAEFMKATAKMKTEDILAKTGLHKSDLSRIRSMNMQRFSIDKMLALLDALGFSARVIIRRKNKYELSS